MQPGDHTYHEIVSQPEAWANALNVVEQARSGLSRLFDADYDQVLFTGCGSTYYLSLAAAALFQEMTGRLARAVPGGELLLNPATAVGQVSDLSHKTLLVAVSRSGSTTETVRAVEQFKAQKRGAVIAITNYGEQPLAGLPAPRLPLGWKLAFAVEAGIGIGAGLLLLSHLLPAVSLPAVPDLPALFLPILELPTIRISLPSPPFTLHPSSFSIAFLALSVLLLWGVGNAILLRGRPEVRQ